MTELVDTWKGDADGTLIFVCDHYLFSPTFQLNNPLHRPDFFPPR